MKTITLKELKQTVSTLMEIIKIGTNATSRSVTTTIDELNFIVTFTPIINISVFNSTAINIYVNRSPVFAYTVDPSSEVEPKLSPESAIFERLVGKLFSKSIENNWDEIKANLENQKQAIVDVGFDHWVKTEIDPRASTGVRISYGDSEGSLMSTSSGPSIEETLEYLKRSLNYRAKSIPYVTNPSKSVTIDLSTFMWGR